MILFTPFSAIAIMQKKNVFRKSMFLYNDYQQMDFFLQLQTSQHQKN